MRLHDIELSVRLVHRFVPRGALVAVALILVPTAFAGQPVTHTLTPSAPSFLDCKAVGGGTICEGSRTLQHGPMLVSDEGGPVFDCASGENAFQIVDSAMVDQHVVRTYDRDGNLTQRTIHEVWRSAQFSNSVTGAAIGYKQSDTITDVLAVPGDVSTATETITGNAANVTVPRFGSIFIQAGRNVYGPDGDLEFAAGPDAANRYFIDGDTSVWQTVCSVLG